MSFYDFMAREEPLASRQVGYFFGLQNCNSDYSKDFISYNIIM